MTTVAVALAAVVAVAAGCSGGERNVDPAAFVAQANQACQKLADDDAGGRAALGPAASADAKASYIRATFGPEAIDTYQRIAAMPMAKEQAEPVQFLMTDAVAEVRLIEADPATGGNRVNQAQLVQRFRDLGLTACGAGFATVLDRATFLERADGLCRDLNTVLSTTARDKGITPDAPAEKKAAFVVADALPQYRSLVSSIEELGYPPDDLAAVTKLVADWRAELDRQQADPTFFFASGRPEAVAVNQAWTTFGAPDCGVNARIAIG